MVRKLLILSILMLVVGCRELINPAFVADAPCETILHPALLSVPFDEIRAGEEPAQQWILTKFPTATIEFDPSRFDGEDEVGRLSWTDGDLGFSLYLYTGSEYIDQLYLGSGRPRLKQIIQCFGSPMYYIFERDVPIGGAMIGTYLELWYPDLGVRFDTITTGFKSDEGYTLETRIIGVTQITPGRSVEEMLRDGPPMFDEEIDRRLSLLKPWPKNFIELPEE